MPSQHTFDGPTLEAVLADVADTHGAAARIVRAEKVRHGGIAGFFARERVEVSIEVDEDPPARSREPSLDAAAVAVTSTPASLLDLVDRVSDEERAAAGAPPSCAPPSCAPPSCDDVVPSTARPSFEAVLRRVVASTGTGSSEEAVDAAATTYRPRPAPAVASPHAELVALGVPAAVA
ncbi:MAG: hypothetical protein M3Q48_12815, partial [Actinomycetota bacterium]|nr:hypothetical protein [Actinomycetota bacterium]